MQDLRDAGYLQEAVRNYLALLGWGYDAETTFFTTEELVEKFSLDRLREIIQAYNYLKSIGFR